MAIDYVVLFDCQPKRHFGNGNHLEGTEKLLDKLKARSRAQFFEEMAAKEGKEPNAMEITQVDPISGKQVPLSYAQLQAATADLDAQAGPCLQCPVNFMQKPFGCFGWINYPIPAEAESWLMERLHPGTVGSFLFTGALQDFGYDGKPIRDMRRNPIFFEARKPLVRDIDGQQVTSDQLFQSFMGVGSVLDPGHVFGILIWLEALEVQGGVPRTQQDAQRLIALQRMHTPEERRQASRLAVGPPAKSAGIGALQRLLLAFHLCFIHDVPLGVSVRQTQAR